MPNDKTILYVDDDDDDRELFAEMIKEGYPGINLVLSENGLKAIDYLQSVELPGKELPCLIVLDLNMPFLDGKKTFEKIKTNPALKNIPIVIFTSSHNPHDKTFFNNAGIELITKPDDYAMMPAIAQRMMHHCID
jgi:CheY-like chemotaxis protein